MMNNDNFIYNMQLLEIIQFLKREYIQTNSSPIKHNISKIKNKC